MGSDSVSILEEWAVGDRGSAPQGTGIPWGLLLDRKQMQELRSENKEESKEISENVTQVKTKNKGANYRMETCKIEFRLHEDDWDTFIERRHNERVSKRVRDLSSRLRSRPKHRWEKYIRSELEDLRLIGLNGERCVGKDSAIGIVSLAL
ncbi:unnamed protein product [Nezara viridula]|uniref:Uncharacterized protein n=1 Tax=Nezara viridula TaxID=85310 RepID=A0A9P0H1C6_NEZVI|nr:unnamed protein product [Nezara viridula]